MKKLVPKELWTESVRLRNRLRFEIRAHAKNPTGALENSWGAAAIKPHEVSIYTGSVYARMRDKGGTIVPRRAQYLSIPLTAGMRGRTPRTAPGGIFVRTKGKTLLYGFKFGKNFRPVFVLKKWVKQTGWDYVEKARNRWLKKASVIGWASEHKDKGE
jgi:hypothetical protein